MKHLFSDWGKVSHRLRAGPALLLFDFDGTLSPIAPTPGRARLAPGSKAVLSRLSRKAGFRVGIVSGRALRDVRRKVALHGVVLSGNHGLEISGLGERFIHPQARAQAAALKKLAVTLRRDIRKFPGTTIEWKGLSFSVHYRRLAPERIARFKKVVRERVRSSPGGFTVRPGHRVFDVLPAVHWDKGAAVRRLIKAFKPHTTLYVGDDRTDRDAFRALGSGNISVSIGRDGAPGARYRLNDISEMRELLQRMARL